MQKAIIVGAMLTLLGVAGFFVSIVWQIIPGSPIKSSSEEASTVNMSAATGEINTVTKEANKASTVLTSNADDAGYSVDKVKRSLGSDQVASLISENAITTVGVQQEGSNNEDLDIMVRDFSDLLYVDSPNFSLENKITIEEDILQFVDQNPESVTHLFDLYEQSYDHDYMTAVIDVISMIENPHIEQFALKQVDNEFNDHTLNWLQILRSTGISSPEDRARVLAMLNQFSDPVMLSNALSTLKYRPYPVDESERETIVSQLQIYLSHENTLVSQAAVDVIENWNFDVM